MDVGEIPPPPHPAVWLALTVFGEAEGEPWDGKVGVAYAIVNRALAQRRSIQDVLFDPYDFSCWNTDSPRRLRIDTLDLATWGECYRAALMGLRRLAPTDPVRGATHYLNPELTRIWREKAGLGDTLPAWAADPSDPTRVDPAKIRAVVHRHTFLIA